MASAIRTIVSLITAASSDGGRACVERATVLRYGVGADAEFLRDRVGAQSFAQLFGDLPSQCGVKCGPANRFAALGAFLLGSSHACARPVTDLLRLDFGQAR